MDLRPTPATTRTALIGGALLLAAGAAACHPAKLGQGRDRADRAVAVADRLECPDRSGDLRLAQAAPDGKSCRYSGRAGEEVTLAYLALDGRPAAEALAPIEAEFRTLVPGAAAPEPGSLGKAETLAGGATSTDEDRPDADRSGADRPDAGRPDADRNEEPRDPAQSAALTPPKPPEPPQVDKDWLAGRRGARDRVRIDMPFLHIDAGDTGARVRGLGMAIDADESGRAVMNGSWNGKRAQINAHDGGVEMRFGAVGERRADLTYIVASDAPGPGGYKAAAYVARGPVAGPLVVATGRSRDEVRGRDDDSVDDLRRLVDRNVRPVRAPR